MIGCRGLPSVLWLVLVAAAGGPVGRAEDWPQFRGPRGDGTWQGPNLPPDWPAAGLSTQWRHPLGGGYAGVVAAAGRVFTFDRLSEPAEVERVAAWDLETGQPLWEHRTQVRYGELDYGSGPRAAATVVGDRVYTLGALGHAQCLNAASGQVVWEMDLVARDQAVIPTWGLAASPVVHRNLVLLHAGVPGGCLMALDRETGREVWRSGDDPAGYATPVLVSRPGYTLVVCWSPQNVLGFDADTGRLLWSLAYPVTYGVSIAAPIFARDRVLVSGYWEGSRAIQLGNSPEAASLVWETTKELQGLMSQPLERDGLVYLLDRDEGLVCFELETGRKRWDDDHQLTPRGRNPQATLVWLGAEDRALALNAEGELVLARLSPEGYRELGRTKIIGPTWAHPAYVGNRVVARSDEALVCVSLVPGDLAR